MSELKPRPCRYCHAPILWLEHEPAKWIALNPDGERHSCLAAIPYKKRRTHAFRGDRSKKTG